MNSQRSLPTVTVCGLGPGGLDRVTAETAAVLESAENGFVRTRRHPSAELAARFESFDELYENADRFDEVYLEIADRVAAAAIASGSVVYAVPGSPLVLERSVRLLRERTDVEVVNLPAVSFLDEVWARLGVDPVDDGVRLVDGHRFATQAAGERGPLLVAHAHANWVLSDIKLAVEAGPDQQAVLLQALGTPDERVIPVAWADLDRTIEADHLTSVYIPELTAPVATELMSSVEMVRRLRAECPWDAEQTHVSLRPYLLEEAGEVAAAIDGLAAASAESADEIADAYVALEKELGDLWFQILLHAQIASEDGRFELADVASTLVDKMVHRHPHVYGDEVYDKATAGKRWAELKAQEADSP